MGVEVAAVSTDDDGRSSEGVAGVPEAAGGFSDEGELVKPRDMTSILVGVAFLLSCAF